MKDFEIAPFPKLGIPSASPFQCQNPEVSNDLTQPYLINI